ncbi:MAG: NAD(+) diphosphatase, partial [Rickettsiales bacterium]
KCGSNLILMNENIEKKCIVCNLSYFPNLSPAVIVLIQNDDKILLARSKNFRPKVYGLIAGFIELGENAESAVHREVKEEVGINIHRLEYFGTQSWPFPNSFMIAYKAHYLSGELIIDKKEIEDAKWFDLNNLPELPYLSSIARKLIDNLLFN